MTRVIGATASDLDTLSRVIADAFFDLPPSAWLIGNLDARRQVFPAFFRIHLEQALAAGVVHTTPDLAAAALWFRRPADDLVQPADYLRRLTAVTLSWSERFAAFDAALESRHPRGTAHHYLAMLAVRPDRQGQGIGTALLDFYHRALDRDYREPAFLEAASPRTRDLYLRHGYVPSPDGPLYLPDGGPPMWPMVREPQPVRARP
jgi:GNAT superfamily N-acetyltransferase